MDETTITAIYFIAGFVIVLIFAINYFNQPGYHFIDDSGGIGSEKEQSMLEPALPKYLTDRFEYNLYLVAYVFVSEIVFFMLVLFLPEILPESVEQPSEPLLPTRQNIVLATLIITGIAPNLPYIKKLLEKSKAYLHSKAQIPRKGRAIYRDLKNSRPEYGEKVIQNILAEEPYCRVGSNGKKFRPDLVETEFALDSWTIGSRYAKLTYLLHHLRNWAKKPPFRGYIGTQELGYNGIETAYEKLFSLKERHEQGLLSESENFHFNSYLDATLHRTYRLLSCLMYLALKSDMAVKRCLQELGYSTDAPKEFYIPWNKLVFMLGAIILSIILGGFVAMGITASGILPIETDITTNKIFRWTGYAVPFLTIPIVLVLCAKRYLSMSSEVWPAIGDTNEKLSLDERPWHIYALISLASLIIGGLLLFLLSVIFKLMGGEDVVDIGSMLRHSFVWAGIVMVTVAYLAYRLDSIQDMRQSITRRIVLNVIGACSQGLATAGATYVAFAHTFVEGQLFNPLSLPDPDQGKMVVYCLITFFMGVSLYIATGYNLFRQKRRSERFAFNGAVELNLGSTQTVGQFRNVSQGGALIECDEVRNHRGRELTISFNGGEPFAARIKRRRKNRINVVFQDKDTWQSLQNEYGLQLGV